jgi:ATP-dependent RNA helicase SUPV3L1/SUV3
VGVEVYKDTIISAVLGPTNTGKTYYAIERMLSYRSGIIGLPLRLLAREVYDKLSNILGPLSVALVTGEERIIPSNVKYWVCTVEAMPQDLDVDFVAIDEIQLCTDTDRGHIFTNRLLNVRGTMETVFMGSDTMRSAIADLEPQTKFVNRNRFSELSYVGAKRLSRLPVRSAIVGFSVDNVYSVAELIRQQKGGCAVVMGALSPRTRNAQVDMYQNGDVDYLVATDAIGMGLNLDISHVAFSALSKFDGRRMRPLASHELAQIAGRAGRYMKPGTYGVTGEIQDISKSIVSSISESNFAPVKKLQWRSEHLDFASIPQLIISLQKPTTNSWLSRTKETTDLASLKALNEDAKIKACVTSPDAVRLIWEICQIPDFRNISAEEHVRLLRTVFEFIHESREIPDKWLHGQISRINRTDGDIDTLSKRLAFIRTWTYVSQKNGWVENESYWREQTRAVEDRLSDFLHAALTQRFVDRRTSILLRRLRDKEILVAEVNELGVVTVEGETIGFLDGFRFKRDKSSSPEGDKALKLAAVSSLVPHFHLKAERFYNSPDSEISFTDQGYLIWGEAVIGQLVKGTDILKPSCRVFVDEEITLEISTKITRRLEHFILRKIASSFEPLHNLSKDEALTGAAKGLAFQLVEQLGVIPREKIIEEVKALEQEDRGKLRKHGVRFGQFTVFMPLLLKPLPTSLRLILTALYRDLTEFPIPPTAGLVTIPKLLLENESYYASAGYRLSGDRAIRIDMLERLADLLRVENSRRGFEANLEMLSITGTSLEQFANIMVGLGYSSEKNQRSKVKETLVVEDTEKPKSGLGLEIDSVNEEPADSSVVPLDQVSNDELETFFIFKWMQVKNNKPEARRSSKQKPATTAKGKSKFKGPEKIERSKKIEKTPIVEKAIDPNNPFAMALMGLKAGK